MRFKPFGFNNIRLSIPEAWELARFDGNRVRGDFVIDDGYRRRLDAAWGILGKGDINELERKVLHKTPGLTVETRIDLNEQRRVYRVEESTGTAAYALATQRALDRFVIVRMFDPPSRWRSMLDTMLAPMYETVPASAEPWRFFATEFSLPPGFLLTDCEMRAGCIRLAFKRRGRMLVIWDVALLSHVEAGGGTAELARGLVAKQYVKRYAFREHCRVCGSDPAEFDWPGRFRLRWILNPSVGWTLCRRALLRGVANRTKDRFSALLLRYRAGDDTAWLDEVAASLREAAPDE